MTTRAPRPYQRKNADEILAHLQRGTPSVVYVLPTGGGKTVVATDVTSTVHGAGWNVVMLVHRRELLRQSVETLRAVGIPARPIDPDHEPDRACPIHVASIDTLKSRRGRLCDWLSNVRLVIPDEAHHAVAVGWQTLLESMPNAQRLGLTATAFRGDGKPLGGAFVAAVRGPTVAELTAAGWLCPAEVWSPVATMEARMQGVRSRRGDYVASDLDRVMTDPAMVKLAVDSYARYMPLEPAIAFLPTVDSARLYAEAFTAAGWRAVSVDGHMLGKERDAAIAGLASGRYQVVTSCQIVSEGTDIPVVAGAILARPTKSPVLAIQQPGRALRTSPGKTRSCIIDIADVTRIHGLPEANRVWSLERGLEPAIHPTTRCPRCHRRFAPAPTCPSCGHAIRGHAAMTGGHQLDMLADSMLRVMGAESLEKLARTEADLRRIAKVKGFAPGWLYYASRRLSERLARQYSARRFG